MRPRISIRGCVRPSVGPLVGMSRFCKKCMKLRVLCTEMIKKAYKVMINSSLAFLPRPFLLFYFSFSFSISLPCLRLHAWENETILIGVNHFLPGSCLEKEREEMVYNEHTSTPEHQRHRFQGSSMISTPGDRLSPRDMDDYCAAFLARKAHHADFFSWHPNHLCSCLCIWAK